MNAMIKPITVIMVFATLVLPSGSSLAVVGTPEYRWGNLHKESTEKYEVVRIVSVLEERIEDQELLLKTKEKLSTMNREEVHVIAGLCERIQSESDTAGADLAFLLITFLITLI